MILQLGGSTRSIIADMVRADADRGIAATKQAIRALEQRIKLYEIALDRILRVPDGSVRLAAPGYVRTVMTARHNAAPVSKTRARRGS